MFSQGHHAVSGDLDVRYRCSSISQEYRVILAVSGHMSFPLSGFSFPLCHFAYQTAVRDIFLYRKAHIYNVRYVLPSPSSCYRQTVFRWWYILDVKLADFLPLQFFRKDFPAAPFGILAPAQSHTEAKKSTPLLISWGNTLPAFFLPGSVTIRGILIISSYKADFWFQRWAPIPSPWSLEKITTVFSQRLFRSMASIIFPILYLLFLPSDNKYIGTYASLRG
mgnify:CR=1 FL=1